MSECKKIRVLHDVKLVADPPASIYRWARDQESIARDMESWAKEFTEFVRDHRSQDEIHLSVKRVYQDQCSECLREWEPVTDENGTYCAWCGGHIAADEAHQAQEQVR